MLLDRRPKVLRKKMRNQNKFKLFGDQAIRRKRQNYSSYEYGKISQEGGGELVRALVTNKRNEVS